MIEPGAALRVTPDVRENAAILGTLLGWEEAGWPDFSMYYPIFAAAPDAAIFGGGVPGGEARRAVSEGAASVYGEGAALFGLNAALPPDEQAAREAEQFAAHCDAMPESLMSGMVEAQRLRDAALARATVEAWEHARAASDTPRVVVIAGNGHAREDWGLPAMLRAYFGTDVEVAALGQYETEAPDDAPYSETLVTEPAERADPCLAFAK